MKHILRLTTIFTLLLFFGGNVWGQILSQYVETDSGTTPKGIEIWNNTGSALDFSTNNLIIQQGTNGGALNDLPGTLINSGTLASGEVLVIGTSDIGTYLTNEGLTGVTFVDFSFNFNGDDALAVKYGGTITDVFGNPGNDPGSSWSGNSVSTENQNIQLSDGITTGDTDGWTDPSGRFETVSTSPSGAGGLDGFGVAPSGGSSNDNDTEVYEYTPQIAGKSISSTVDTQGEAEDVFIMTIEDQGSGDGEPTKVTNIRVKPHTSNTADWTDAIQDVFVNDGTDFIYPTATITDTYIDLAFGASDLTVPDGTSNALDITLWIYLNTSGITDGHIISFMVDADDHGFTADATGSGFISPFTLGDFNSNDITIEVTPTELQFKQHPSNVSTNENIVPAPTVAFTDANGNIDLDLETANVRITATGATLSGSPIDATIAANGIATFSSLQFTTEGSGVTLTASDNEDWLGTTASVISNAFDVTDVALAGDVIINEIDMDGDPGYQQEAIELLVVNGPLSLRNWVLREDSEGNEIAFADNAIWDAVPTGTAIAVYVRTGSGATEDVDYTDGLMTVNVDGTYLSGTLLLASTELFYLFRGPSSEGNAIDAVNCGEIVSNNYGLTIPDIGSGAAKYFVNGSSYNNDDASHWFDFSVTQRTFGEMNPGQGTNPYVYGGTDNDWTNSANWSFGVVPDATTNVSIPATKASIEIASNQTADCYNLTVEGSLTIKSDASSTGSLIIHGTATGDISVERHLGTDNEWHYIASPVDLAASSFDAAFGSNDPTEFFRWDEDHTEQGSTGWWIDIRNFSEWTNSTFNPGEGYAISYWEASKGSPYSLTGAPNDSDVSISLTKTTGSSREGWNLVGNPFPSTLAANTGAAANNFISTNTSLFDAEYGGIYFYDETINDYITITNASAETYIDNGHAFMVKTNTHEASLLFNKADRKHGSATFYKNGKDEYERFILSALDPQGDYTKTEIVFIQNMTKGLDPTYDGAMLQGNSNLALYSKLIAENTNRFSIQALPLLEEKMSVKLGFETTRTGEFTFTASNLESFSPSSPISLEDLGTGELIDLKQNPIYTFTITEPGIYDDRFIVHFKSAVGINEAHAIEGLNIYSHNNSLYLNSSETRDATLEMFNVTGQQVYARQVVVDGLTQINPNLKTGWYVVKMSTDEGMASEKVFIK